MLRARVRAFTEVLFRPSAGQHIDVDDVVQEVVLRLQSPDRLARLAASAAPAGYVAALVRNTAYNLVRRGRLLADSADEIDLAPAENSAAALDPDTIVLASEVLSRLSPADVELVRLRFWEDLSVQEIADRLDISYAAAAVRLSRLIRRLRQALATDASD